MLHERAGRRSRNYYSRGNPRPYDNGSSFSGYGSYRPLGGSSESRYGSGLYGGYIDSAGRIGNVPPAPRRDYGQDGYRGAYRTHGEEPETDFGQAGRDARSMRRQEETSVVDKGHHNEDGSITFPLGTRVALLVGYQKRSPKAPDDWAYRKVGDVYLPATTTLRQVGGSLDLDKATVTRVYRVESHPGDGASTKEQLLERFKFMHSGLFRRLPPGIRAMRLEITKPGYKRVR